jgi:hypothetical protein
MKTLTAATSGNGSQTGKERKVKEGGSALRAEDVPLSPSAVLFMSAVVRCRLQHHNFRKQQQTAAGSRTSSLTLLQEGPRLRSCFFFFCVLHNSFSFFFAVLASLKQQRVSKKRYWVLAATEKLLSAPNTQQARSVVSVKVRWYAAYAIVFDAPRSCTARRTPPCYHPLPRLACRDGGQERLLIPCCG